MDIRSMHIEIQQSTQQVAANRRRKWYPEEIDWVLNKMQNRFIASCLRARTDGSGGFELDTAKSNSIRMLITTKETIRPFIVSDTRYEAMLPADMAFLLDDWAVTEQWCGAATPQTSSETQFITRLQQKRSGLSAAPFYATLIAQLSGTTVSIPADASIGHTYTGLPEKEDVNFLVPWILSRARDIYWERYDKYYHPQYYIIVTSSAPGTVALTIDGSDQTVSATVTRSMNYHSSTGKGTQVASRLTPSDRIRDLNQSAYWRTAHNSPISELSGTNLVIYRDSSFTVTNVGVTYIRKPQPMSLSLNSDCELAGEDTHQAICDLATEYILGTIKDPEGTKLKEVDISKRVVL
jgi:hypothetical protein